MSISVTVSGEDSTSVVLAQALSDTVSVSGISAVQVTTTSGDAATVTVSTGDPITITGNYSNYVTGDVVRPNEISNFLTSSQISSNIDSAINSLVDSAPDALNTLNELAAALNDDENFGSDTIVSISNLNSATGELSTATGLLVQKSETGIFYTNDNPSGFITGVDLSDLQTATGNLDARVSANDSDIDTVSGLITSNDGEISALQTATGLLVQKSETGNFITDSDTGAFYAASNPSGFITGVDLSNYVETSETGNFITDSDTGAFYASSNPSGFITGVDLSSYVQDSETGLFLVSGEDAVVNTLGVGDAPDANIDLHVKSTSAKFLVENTLAGGEWVRFSAGTVGTSMKFANTASFGIGPVASKTDQSVVNDFYMNSSGNIGIGTDAPSAKLHVAGDAHIGGEIDIIKPFEDGVRERLLTARTSDATAPFFFINNGTISDDSFAPLFGGYTQSTTLFAEAFGGFTQAGYDTSDSSSYGLLHFYASRTTDASNPLNGTLSDPVNRKAITFGHGPGSSSIAMTIAAGGNVGIGISTPSEKLHVNGGGLQIGSTPTYSFSRSIKLLDNGVQYGARVSLVGTDDDGYPGLEMVTDGNLSKRTLIRHEGEGNNDYGLSFYTTNNSVVSESVRFNGDGSVGIGTSSPSEKLDVRGDALISGVLNIRDISQNSNKSITAANNNLTFSNVHGIFGYSIGLRGNRGSTLGMESAGSILDISAPSDITLTPGGVTDIQSDLNVYGNTITTGDLTVSGNSFFQNRPTVNGTGVLLSGEGGGGAVENVVYTTGDQEVSGIKNFSETLKAGKITLSENSFVTETGNFTISSTHRGATVLLQNSNPITVTVPAQVSGHVTTFIAETSSTVLFATGAGISGLNSFGGANQIAGIFGQAQIIFKSNEYAFLGGNLA